MTNLWSGRFDTAPDAAAFQFGASFRFDRRLFEDDVTGSLAWARALAKAGVLTGDQARQIEDALTAILAQGTAEAAFVDGPDEDVHSFVERLLVERLGDAGRRLHTGRSRNEQVSLDLRLYLRRRIPLLKRAVAGVVGALAAQADAATDALMPSFTHFRPAQPVLVAHFFLSHAAPLRRDYARLAGAREESDALPLGSGAIAGTAYDVDVDALARDLGFTRVVANSMDASSDRDFAATFLYACAMTMVHLSRLAEDLIILCGDEHRFFELSDALSTGSSMMPQKKNPDPLELVRGKSGRAIGHLVGLLTTIKGLPTRGGAAMAGRRGRALLRLCAPFAFLPCQRYLRERSCNSASFGLVTYWTIIVRASDASRTTPSWHWSARTSSRRAVPPAMPSTNTSTRRSLGSGGKPGPRRRCTRKCWRTARSGSRMKARRPAPLKAPWTRPTPSSVWM